MSVINTPSTHEPEVLEHLLVARHDLLGRIVDKVGACTVSRAQHHQLLIGPRGIGKTHMVSLIHHRLACQHPRDDLVLAWLREDQYGLTTFDRLIERVIKAIGADLDPTVAPVDQLKQVVGPRPLVVIVENLNDVFRRLKPSGQRALRSLIQEWERVVIVAATPSLFDGVSSRDEPFYGFFEITHLEELSLNDAAELLARVGDLRGNPSTRDIVHSRRGLQRLTVIRTLAGGHPRIWMLFADCLNVEELDELVPHFLKALDDLMPYYQARMGELEGQQEEMVALLCEQRSALTVKDIARLCDINERTAASQLVKLQGKAYVRKVQLDPSLGSADERESYYELREPLMRLCLNVKDARAKPIRLIVEFLKHWFDEPDEHLLSRMNDGTIVGQYADADGPQHMLDRAVIYVVQADLARFAETIKTGLGVAREQGSRYLGDVEAYMNLATQLDRDAVREFVRITFAAYGATQAIPYLAIGIVKAIPALLALSDERAEHWCQAWNEAGAHEDSMIVALRILNTANAWRRDGKRTHLMRLAKEERDLLIALLPKQRR